MHTKFDMTLGAIVAMVLDYAAVAFVVGLLLFDRWMGIRRGITLDTILVLIALLGVAAWFAGSRLRQRLAHDAGIRGPVPEAGADQRRGRHSHHR